LLVHTLPSVVIDSFRVFAGKHTTIAASCPQGKLTVQVDGGGQYRGLHYIVRQAGDLKTLNIQELGQKEKYLVGQYDIEIPILPRKYLYGVKIDQSTTTTVTIPRPGILNLLKDATGFGSIYLLKSIKDQEWICNLDVDVKNETYVLQPGTYRVVFRSQNSKRVLNTISRKFEIKSGGSATVKLY
jgi:Ca-activated chloride channel family protein